MSPRRAAERLHHEMLDEFGAMAEESSGSESEVSSDEDDEVDMFEQMRQTVEVRVKRAVLADWVTFIRRIKHHQMKAALCLQRCARLGELAGGGEQMWVGERVMLVFEVWRRYTIFRRSIRNQTGIPVFPKRLRQWNNFVDLYQARKMRERKAMLVRPPLPPPPAFPMRAIHPTRAYSPLWPYRLRMLGFNALPAAWWFRWHPTTSTAGGCVDGRC